MDRMRTIEAVLSDLELLIGREATHDLYVRMDALSKEELIRLKEVFDPLQACVPIQQPYPTTA